jgi:flagellar basal body P-ring protein FlgI
MTRICSRFIGAALVAALLVSPVAVRAERIKDLATVAGVRGNQLLG